MPILNKYRIRTPFEEFENYLGEEMNAFSEFFMEELMIEDENGETENESVIEAITEDQISGSFWLKIKSFFSFKK